MQNNTGDIPVFSIITPSFNQGKFIEKTIQSVITQAGNFYIDYIITDGGSTDETVSIIKSFEEMLSKNRNAVQYKELNFVLPSENDSVIACKGISFRWKSEKDKGQSDAINKGFMMSAGEMIAWLNSDDRYCDSSTLQKASENLKNNDVVFGGALAHDEKGQELWRHNPGEFTFYSSLYRQEGIPQPSIFWKRTVFSKIGLLNIDLHYGMDYDYWWRMLQAGFKFHRIDEFLSIQIYHPDSKSRQGGELFEAFKPEERILKQKYKKLLGIKRFYYMLKLKLEK